MDISLTIYSIYYLYKGSLNNETQLATKSTRKIDSIIINHKINWKKGKEKKKRRKERKKASKLWEPRVYWCPILLRIYAQLFTNKHAARPHIN